MKYGLLGEKLSHSFSPRIHSMLGNDDYGLFSVEKEDFRSFMENSDFKAVNVTIPYKKAVIPYLDFISENAMRIGSVNTVVRGNDGRLHGFNTDYTGLRYMLWHAGIELSGKKVIILGSGGTSLTAHAVAEDMGADRIVVVSRKGEDNYENLSRHRDTEVIINTTPVGMFPKNGERLIKLSDFPALKAVADVIYNPFYTEILLDAREKGIKYSNGLRMLVAQAVAASRLFFYEGEARAELPLTDEDRGKIEDIYRELFNELSNIVFVGMPSCGKSSLAKALAEVLDKRAVDSDEEIVKESCEKIPAIFEKEGEEGFRKRESAVIRELGKQRGLVIATGGGAVLMEENRRALRQNAIVVFVKRNIESLSLDGRPLSKSREELYKMYEKRLPFYEACADITVDNNGDLADTVAHIVEELRNYEAACD